MTVAVPKFRLGASSEIFPVKYGELFTPDASGPGAIVPVRVGTIAAMVDDELGWGEFIFLKGVGSCAVGSAVIWTDAITTSAAPAFQTVLAPTTTLQGRPIAFATAAIIAGSYGWFQISGYAVVLSNGTHAIASALYMQAAGVVSTTGAAGAQILNARTSSAVGVPSGNLGISYLNRSFLQGAIT
jgi:hypothetical protein